MYGELDLETMRDIDAIDKDDRIRELFDQSFTLGGVMLDGMGYGDTLSTVISGQITEGTRVTDDRLIIARLYTKDLEGKSADFEVVRDSQDGELKDKLVNFGSLRPSGFPRRSFSLSCMPNFIAQNRGVIIDPMGLNFKIGGAVELLLGRYSHFSINGTEFF
jgi:hypothetical protein